MIQKFTLYRFEGVALDAEQLADQLAASVYVPALQTQDLAFGFVPPREENGAMVEAVGGALIARLMIERRSVPGAALRKRVEAEAAHIEATTGRKPGKKERRALKEDALLALLPQAFPKHQAVPLWFDRLTGLLVVGATVGTVLDLVVTALVRAVPDLVLTMVQTKFPPGIIMAGWLAHGEAADDFVLGRECELRSNSEEKSAVRFTHHNLETGEIRKHITEGKMPRRLALEWSGRVAFRLSDTMAADKVEFLEGCFKDSDTEGVDAFDADVAIATGELRGLIAGLIDAMGGEMVIGGDVDPDASSPAAAAQRMDDLMHANGTTATLSDSSGKVLATFGAKPPPDVLAAILAKHPDADPKLVELAAALVMAPDGRASISWVQRQMKIGYNAAARVLEMLEEGGVVSAMKPDGTRAVLIKAGAA